MIPYKWGSRVEKITGNCIKRMYNLPLNYCLDSYNRMPQNGDLSYIYVLELWRLKTENRGAGSFQKDSGISLGRRILEQRQEWYLLMRAS